MRRAVKLRLLIAGVVVATLAATVLYLNLSSGDPGIGHPVEPLYGVGEPQFLRVMGHLLGPPLVAGNRIVNLENGDEIFPAMLDAIAGAERSITFETFVYWSGEIAERFTAALAERARAGVRVHVLLDWYGSEKLEGTLLDAMRDAGVEVERYNKPGIFDLNELNNRTHRKLLVVDGRVGFTGGVGIADLWLGDAQDPEHWRDSHFRVEGPVVAQMQAAFLDNWMQSRSAVLHGEDYFPPLTEVGDVPAQMFASSPRGGADSARLMVLLSLAAARESILIGNAYFVPDDVMVASLVDAVERGVEVRILVPGEHIDTDVTRGASVARWGELLEAGVEIYEYAPTMYHTKLMIVDDAWVSVGSANFDNRSFRLNDEANLNCLDRDLAARLSRVFAADIARSHRMTHDEWVDRPWHRKLRENAAELLRSQL